MTQYEKIKFVLEKYPDIGSEEMFLWHYAEEFYDVSIYMLKQQFINFWKEASQLDGQILPTMEEFQKDEGDIPHFTLEKKEEKIQVPPNQPEEPSFKDTLNEEDKKDYEEIFGDKDYKDELFE